MPLSVPQQPHADLNSRLLKVTGSCGWRGRVPDPVRVPNSEAPLPVQLWGPGREQSALLSPTSGPEGQLGE